MLGPILMHITHQVYATIITILQMKKLRCREDQYLVPGITTSLEKSALESKQLGTKSNVLSDYVCYTISHLFSSSPKLG